ncbi:MULTISPECIES: LuxR C-terminal-related transcriptional regulator [unclassified Spirosoma]|uniref:response regulator transcription factor n=1 Tax=unclassified Spirosoma TaxID=2621999 RepID=UPI00095B0743|nr:MULTISPECIES: LuxR C-terminal-related transcriptional regulator [unclassified Spirosoma]MBN8821579.1 response regulator transcription factor [Spirosoma sp.]OJW78351.1 MAG: helix-turn-helix transcriptional regulator [Spirosoma sp. 48-14]
MTKSFTTHVIFLGCILLLSTVGYSQKSSYQQLEQKVYLLNNELKYNESQALLLPILQDDKFSADEKYQASILLSYTYKRVYDYQSALKFLKTAQTFAEQTPNKALYTANIQSEEAFILFDTHDYQKADRLMASLEKSGFKHINQENKSKLIMQQGYLLFVKKQYEQAEATYDRAIVWMQASAPCHLPMIYVKKMQLYNAMNRPDLLAGALKKSTFYADSCKIIKYHLYAYEELREIYKAKNDLPHLVQTQKKLDSLNVIFAREQNISSLHNQKESIVSDYINQKLQNEKNSKGYLAILLAALALIALALLSWLVASRRKQRRLEGEFLRMKLELETYLARNRTAVLNRNSLERGDLNVLSERQQEVLEYMAMGMPNKAIADKLCISENTVKYHIKNIYLLLDIKDRKEFLVTVKK